MLIDNNKNNIPDYYPTMYLDGYKPHEILNALHKKMREEFIEDVTVDSVTIKSEIRVKS